MSYSRVPLLGELAQRIYDERYQPDGRLYPVIWREFPGGLIHCYTLDTVFARLYGGTKI